MNWRGSQTFTDEINGQRYPYLPIIHPAAILRDWGLRSVTCQDLRSRARRFIQGTTAWSPPREHFDFTGDFKAARDYLVATICRAGEAARRGERLWLAVDVETWRRRYLAVVGISDGEFAIAIPFFFFDEAGNMVDNFTLEQELEIQLLLRQLLQHVAVNITNQNYAYDWQYLHRYLGIWAEPSFDTMLAHHLLWPGTPKSLDYLASLYCDHYCYWKDESQDWDAKSNHRDMWRYNCKDTIKTYEITFALQSLLKSTKMEDLYELQLEQWKLANEMQTRGIKWDYSAALRMREELVRTADSLSQWLMRAMPEDLQYAPSGKPWFASNSHLQYIFYDRLGVPPILHKKTKRPTLDKESFEQLKKKTPWIGPILDKLKLLRSVQVFRDNFLSKNLGPDGRMHPSFNVGGTETFRWSSSENPFGEGMNLQNIPRLDDE